MSKVGRNEPCPCGSGKKYKKCCAGAVRAQSAPLAPPANLTETRRLLVSAVAESLGYLEDDLEELSNSVVDLINARRYDQALDACQRLLTDYPEVVDGLERSAMVYEARGDFALALDFYRRALAFTEHPDQRDGFDDEGRNYFREKIAELDAGTHPSHT